MVVLHLRARYVDMKVPSLSFYGPAQIIFHCDTHTHRLMEPEIWFGDDYDPIHMRRMRIGRSTYLVFHTNDISYDVDVLGQPLFSGRAIVLRESTRNPYPPINMWKDTEPAMIAVKRLATKTRSDLPDLQLEDPDVTIPESAYRKMKSARNNTTDVCSTDHDHSSTDSSL
ncbi:hypothetical protein NM688_g6892 [Phlebia brevispora]|uniref:Uncharacterized protein n=1 Tax=Phlebia brevispora TaxID=194682 RepID=A0ACC1SB94_9APHY|nr:hypothetical protein NM688_g6892 [Phlebia brevispora]